MPPGPGTCGDRSPRVWHDAPLDRHGFIAYHPVLPVDKGDLFTVAGGLVVILVIAVIANPGVLPAFLPGAKGTPAVQEVQETTVPTTVPTVLPSPTPTPAVNQTPPLPPGPARILYTKNPFTYPVIHLPDRMETFGGSDRPLIANQTVTFAYVEGSGGGLTTVFTVPYEMWALNVSVNASSNPQYSDFRMVLCDAKTGAFITGGEVQNGGTMYKVVRYTGPMYLIIGANYVDSFTISLETPYSYYAKTAGSGT